MIHFLPESFAPDTASPYGEAVARLAGIRTALTIAQQAAGVPTDVPSPIVPADFPDASAARRRCFDTRSIESAQAAAAGLEMLAAQRATRNEAHPQSVALLADTLRADLDRLGQLFSL